MCRKKNFSTGNWRTLWKDFFPQPIHPHSTAPVDTRRVAADNAHGSFLQIVTSLTRPVSAAGVPPEAILHGNLQQIVTAPPVPGIVTGWKSRQRTKAPLAKGGWFGEAKPGGFPRLAGFHIGLYFQEVPTVNPSVTATPCQLPLAREPLGCSDEAPLAKGGWFGEAKPGG